MRSSLLLFLACAFSGPTFAATAETGSPAGTFLCTYGSSTQFTYVLSFFDDNSFTETVRSSVTDEQGQPSTISTTTGRYLFRDGVLTETDLGFFVYSLGRNQPGPSVTQQFRVEGLTPGGFRMTSFAAFEGNKQRAVDPGVWACRAAPTLRAAAAQTRKELPLVLFAAGSTKDGSLSDEAMAKGPNAAAQCEGGPLPKMPMEAIRQSLSGVVQAEAVVVQGQVTGVEVLSSTGDVFSRAAKDALMQWRCTGSGRFGRRFEFKID